MHDDDDAMDFGIGTLPLLNEEDQRTNPMKCDRKMDEQIKVVRI